MRSQHEVSKSVSTVRLSRVIRGEALKILQSGMIQENSVDCLFTSPPYYHKRDYKHHDQLGWESTPNHFVERLCDIFEATRKVLKPDATVWVNLGETYDDESALGVPSRFQAAMLDRGWYGRNDIIWIKSTHAPEPVKDRFTHCYEHVYFFAQSKEYYFNQLFNLRKTDPVYETFKTERLQHEENRRGRKDNGAYGKHGGHKSLSDIFARLAKGKNQVDAWYFPPNRVPTGHTAPGSLDLAARCITAGCKEGGVVLDPFAGRGGTGLAALLSGRTFTGIELNSEYAREMAEELRKVA